MISGQSNMMIIEEIERDLPNGFHDSNLVKVEVDYLKREAVIYLRIDISDPDDTKNPGKIVYREGELHLTDLVYFVLEPPDDKYDLSMSDGLWIANGGELKEINTASTLPTSVPEGAFEYWFFINDWNCFIYFSAMGAYWE